MPRTLVAAAVLTILGAADGTAQTPPSPRPARHWESVVPSGRLVPTGAQRATIQGSGLTAAQLFYVVRPGLALGAALGWARSRDVATPGDPRLDVDATHNLAAYASAGGEFGYRRLRLRLELRDYVTGFKPLDGPGGVATRNDIVWLAGLRLAGR